MVLCCSQGIKKQNVSILSAPSFRKTAEARIVSRVEHTVPVHTKGTEIKDGDSH